jgi:hypothetical protein
VRRQSLFGQFADRLFGQFAIGLFGQFAIGLFGQFAIGLFGQFAIGLFGQFAIGLFVPPAGVHWDFRTHPSTGLGEECTVESPVRGFSVCLMYLYLYLYSDSLALLSRAASLNTHKSSSCFLGNHLLRSGALRDCSAFPLPF